MSPDPDLAAFVRRERGRLLRAGGSPRALASLGLDDGSLDRWQHASRSLVTLPHASPNVFFPRVRVGWFAASRQAGLPHLHHVRIVLTHVNFSDLGWRPYAWWYMGADGTLHCSRQFTRSKKLKHVIVGSRPRLGEIPEGVRGADGEAAELALSGADLSASYMLIMSAVERAAGLAAPGAVTYLPLNWLVRFAREQSGTATAVGRWLQALLTGAEGRRVDDSGRLVPCPPADAHVLDNTSNQALLALLGETEVLGGGKMAAYWPDIEARLDRLRPQAPATLGAPRPVTVPDVLDQPPVHPAPALLAQLVTAGIPYSQGLAVAEHGAFMTPR
ncbi:hypothetical protein GCM10022223_61060 [Kineosporia mesophila]|uniref:Uncharacterized protein n=1 Tax=Kineosporia mesophila TaxID=566012 RepID=A0ABP7AL37_9ACTN|nr:hypothetical protein [Kineosporia mesophila]MCD5355032.1 hypothetical protein [Kineosporia mesophila]